MRIISLQLIRFIAAILVLFFHLGILRSGFKGVDVFFVISGFIMYHSLFHDVKPTLKKFIVNRITKIYFLYWVALFILNIVRPYNIDLAMLKSIFLVPGHKSIFRYSWSLSYELYFYFVVGVVAYLVPPYLTKRVIVVFFVLSSTVMLYHFQFRSIKGSIINFLLGANIWQFLLGVMTGYLSSIKFGSPRPEKLWLIALIAVIMMIFIDLSYTSMFGKLLYGLLAGIIIFFSFIAELNTGMNDKISKFINVLGNSSYAIYLFGPVISLIFLSNAVTNKFMIIAATILIAILINVFVENPLLKKIRFALLVNRNNSLLH